MKKTSVAIIVIIAVIVLCCWSLFALAWTQGMMEQQKDYLRGEASVERPYRAA